MSWMPLLAAVGFALWVTIGSTVAWLIRRVLGSLESPGSFGETFEIAQHVVLWPIYLFVLGVAVILRAVGLFPPGRLH